MTTRYTLPTGDKVRTTATRRYLIVPCLPGEHASVDSSTDDRDRAMARASKWQDFSNGPGSRTIWFVIDQQTNDIFPKEQA